MENQIYIACWAGVVYIMLAVGAVGSFIPVVPGPLLAGLAVLCFKIFVPSAEISWWLAVQRLRLRFLRSLWTFLRRG